MFVWSGDADVEDFFKSCFRPPSRWMFAQKVTGSVKSPGLCFLLAIIQRPPVDVISKPCEEERIIEHIRIV